MSLYTQLKQDLKRKFPMVQSALNEGASRGAAILGNFTKQLNGYEKRVKTLARELDQRKREARNVGKVRLDKFVKQLRQTRSHVEGSVVTLVTDERKRINARLDELLGFLNKTERKAKATAAPAKRTKRTAAKKRTTKKKRSAASR